MHNYAVLGHSLPYTLSPLIYNTAFNLLNISARYSILEIEPEYFTEHMASVKRDHKYKGFNITIPYKTTIISLLDEIDAVAEEIGAVNTVIDQDGRWKGFNTDITGFIKPLQIRGAAIKTVVILGAGGAARAVVYALSGTYGAKIHLVVRDQTKGEEFTKRFADSGIERHPFKDISRILPAADLLVNTTPVGTSPQVNDTPLPDISGLSTGCIVYDLVYNPPLTRLLRDAISLNKNIICIGGLEMLLGQAADAFRLWTGRELPEDEVREKLMKRLGMRDEG